jgi:hypothetical protein
MVLMRAHLFAHALPSIVVLPIGRAYGARALPGLLAVHAAFWALDAHATSKAIAKRTPGRWAGLRGVVGEKVVNLVGVL